MSDKYLIVVAGPTAVGKTELCIQLAQFLNTEIISADSRQFFKELSIGTAKPTPGQLAQVTHHFINSHSISESYSAGEYERDALQVIEEFFLTKDCLLLTGGSGLYIKAVCEGLDNLPQPEPGLREELMNVLREDGLDYLQSEVLHIDPTFSSTPEFYNPQRVVRALEVFFTSGRAISSFRTESNKERPFNIIKLALDRDRSELYERINKRMDEMLKAGLVEEVLRVSHYRHNHALKTVGYKEVFDFLDGVYNEVEMIRLLKQNTRRYAKRQITWFKHQGGFKWFNADEYDSIRNWIAEQMIHH